MSSERQKFGILTSNHTRNLGDKIQAFAAMQYLPGADYLIDRETGKIVPRSKNNSSHEKIRVLCTGMLSPTNNAAFPLSERVEPLFKACYIDGKNPPNEACLITLKKNEPIGCRDDSTVAFLTSKNIKAYFSGCLTLTLEKKFVDHKEDILVVDAHINVSDVFNAIVPRNYRRKASYLSQTVPEDDTKYEEEMELTEELLTRLEGAKIVFTSRFQTMLACLALETTVIYLTDNKDNPRLNGYRNYVKMYTKGDKLDVNLDTYRNPNSSKLNKIKEVLREEVSSWVGENKHIKDGYSIFTACMNRTAHLEKALPTWLETNPNEIVIVDWGSKPSIKPIIEKYNKSKKIKLITVTNVTKWVLTWAFNLAARHTTYSRIFKVDCDTTLDKDFFVHHNLERGNVFFAGEWSTARTNNEIYNNGLLYVQRNLFFRSKGYPENITTYGFDDCSIKKRLSKLATCRPIDVDKVKHMEHKDEDRIAHQKLAYGTQLDVEIERNRLIDELELWNGFYSRFSVEKVGVSEYKAKHIYSVEMDEALRERLLLQAVANREYVRKQIEEKKEPPREKKLIIKVQNGLGNRLRALASAYCIAKATGRKLVVIWEPDMHCGARFEDLFKPTELLKDILILEKELESIFEEVVKYLILENEFVVKNKVIYDYMNTPGSIIDDTRPEDIFVVSASVLKSKHTDWNKENTFLRSLAVQDAIASKVAELEHKYSISTSIGVHIRMGQPVSEAPYEDTSGYTEEGKRQMEKWRKLSNFNVFLKEIKRIARLNKNQRFFVCCDNQEAYAELKKAMPRNVISIEQESYGRDTDAVIMALVQLKLLASAKSALGSNWSSYSEMIERLSGKNFRKSGIDFMP